jgi:hypothetical protein
MSDALETHASETHASETHASDALTTHTILTRKINSRVDMLEVEEAITQQLGGELYRCAFLRSRAYVRLRRAALYPTHFPAPCTALHGNLSVVLSEGPIVSLLWLDKVHYFQDEWCYKGKRKRPREASV